MSLQKLGYKNLYGIELNPHIVELARSRVSGFSIIQGDALDIPFKDGFFDVVLTSNVLIHIAPGNIRKALKEIGRCSKKYIWGFEYYAKEYTEINYRGHPRRALEDRLPEIVPFCPRKKSQAREAGNSFRGDRTPH